MKGGDKDGARKDTAETAGTADTTETFAQATSAAIALETLQRMNYS